VVGHFFLSYSPADASEFALRLADAVSAGPPPYPVWVDQRDLRPGEDWDDQVVEALRSCQGVLFVMTEAGVEPDSPCKREWVQALKYKKPVIPLRLHPAAELPYRLGPREFIDMSDFGLGMARLRQYLATTGTPEGALRELNTRRDDADRQLSRSDPQRRPMVEREIVELRRRIEEMQRLIENPAQELRQTAERIEAALQRQRQPERPAPAAPARARFVNPPPLTAPRYFQDRHHETALLADYLGTPDLRLITVTGRGGLGKTSMVCRLLKALEAGRLPDGPPAPEVALREVPSIDGIVYLSPTGGHPVSFPNLFADLCRLVPEEMANALSDRYKEPGQTPTRLMYALLEALPGGCTVLLLDNFEDHIDAGTGTITDSALDEALRALLTAPEHGVKVVLTTRVAPRALLLTHPSRQRRLGLDEGLGSPYAENVLRASDPDGSLGLREASPEQLATARERTRGYPRALEALAAILAADRDTTLPDLLAETARLPDNVVEALVGEAYNRLDSLSQQVMQALAIYPTPVPPVAVDYLLQPYRAAIDAAPVLARLVNMQFVRRDGGRYYLHQVDREYALERLRDADSPIDDGDRTPNGSLPFDRRALEERGADFYARTRTPRETWKTIDDLAPQLAEYELRCRAGDYDDAASVLLDIDFDFLILWGHIRYTVELHERLQGHLSDPWIRSSALNNLGTCYFNLAMSQPAANCHRQALAISYATGDRQGEAVGLNNLAGCSYMLGEVTQASDFYRQALSIHRDIGDRLGEAANLTGLANCYLWRSDYAVAEGYYQQALEIGREIGSRRDEANGLAGLASCYYMRDDYPRAVKHCRQALAIRREVGDRLGEASNLGDLGRCFSALGDYTQAVDYFAQALAIHRDTGDRTGESIDLYGLAGCFFEQGDYVRGLNRFEQALDIARDIGDRLSEASSLRGIARYLAVHGDYARAVDLYERALIIDREIGDRPGESGSLAGLARCASARGEFSRAMAYYRSGLTVNREIGNRQGVAERLCGLAYCDADCGQTDAAIANGQEALTIKRDIRDRAGEASALVLLGVAYADRCDWKASIDSCAAAFKIAGLIGNRVAEGEAGATLATACLLAGDLEEARRVAEASVELGLPDIRAGANLVLGVAELRLGNHDAALPALTASVEAAEERLRRDSRNFEAFDIKALALSALSLIDGRDRADEVAELFGSARAITSASQIRVRTERLLRALEPDDRH